MTIDGDASTNTTTEQLPYPILIGDIGGTNARFAILADPQAGLMSFEPVRTADYPDIQSAVAASVLSQTDIRPRTAIIALAAPIDGDEIDLTNAHWVVQPRAIMAALDISDVVLLNDFEALALALATLSGSDLHPIGGGVHEPFAARIVVGPGTGLGTAGLVYANGLWVPVPGEGGHISLGPAAPEEFALWPFIEPEMGRISAESLLAGRGLLCLYRAFCTKEAVEPVLDTPATVTDAALGGNDGLAARTIEFYCRLLGRVAGDLALLFMANGGVYIGGGIAPRLLPFLDKGGFREAFENKAPHDQVVAAMATSVIVAKRPALTGIAAYARNPEQYGVSLDGRHWRAD
ncbi:MAG: glucokinase [Alphaproteobacteria bacterium]